MKTIIVFFADQEIRLILLGIWIGLGISANLIAIRLNLLPLKENTVRHAALPFWIVVAFQIVTAFLGAIGFWLTIRKLRMSNVSSVDQETVPRA